MEEPPKQVLRRAPVLEACREKPRSRHELETITDRSRATIYRATVELEEEGLLDRAEDGYRTTGKGQALSYAVEEYRNDLDAIERLEPLLEEIDHPELLENAYLLDDAEITTPGENNMYRANDRVIELWMQAETIRSGMTGSGSRQCLPKSAEYAIENGMDIEMCFLPDAIPTPEHLDDIDVDRLLDAFNAQVTDAVPFTFLLFDDQAAIVSHNEVGIPMIVAETKNVYAYKWLEKLYQECKASARPIEPAVV